MTTSRATLALAWGSKSITSTFFSRSTSAPARLITVVVFPTPPLLFATHTMRGRVGAGFVIHYPFCLYPSRATRPLYDRKPSRKISRFFSKDVGHSLSARLTGRCLVGAEADLSHA